MIHSSLAESNCDCAANPPEPPAPMWSLKTVHAANLELIDGCVRCELAKLRNLSPTELPEQPERALFREQGYLLDSIELLELCAHITQLCSLDLSGLEEYLLRKPSLQNWADLVTQAQQRGAEWLRLPLASQPNAVVETKWELLEQEGQALKRVLPAGARIVSLVPRQTLEGCWWGIMLPRVCSLAGLDLSELGPDSVVDFLEAGDVLVGTDRDWRKLTLRLKSVPASFSAVTLGRDSDESQRWRKTVGVRTWLQQHLESELGLLGWRRSPDAAFELPIYWQWAQDGSPRLVRQLPDFGQYPPRFVNPLLRWEDAHRRAFRL